MTTGNLAKKRHLDVPSREVTRTASVQKAAATNSYMVRSHTKRNLLQQYDDNITGFVKPNGNSLHPKRVVYSNKKGVSFKHRSSFNRSNARCFLYCALY